MLYLNPAKLHRAYYHYQDSLRSYRSLHKRRVGPYMVRSWLDRDGKVLATGWFTM